VGSGLTGCDELFPSNKVGKMDLKEAIETCKRDYAVNGTVGDALSAVIAAAERVHAGVPWEVRHRDIGVVMEGALFSGGEFNDYVRPGESRPVLIVRAE
jgi:hypothetical protein